MNSEKPSILKKFLKYLINTRNYSKNTAISYEFDLIIFFKYICEYLFPEIEMKNINVFILSQIEEKDIFSFLIYLNYKRENSAETRNRKLAALKTFFRYLYTRYSSLKDKLNPINNIEKAEEMIRLPRYLKLEEAKRIQSIFNEYNSKNYIRNNTIIILFLQTGMRLSELKNIKVKDIDFENKTIKITCKGNKEKIVYLNAVAIDSIRKYLSIRNYDEDEYLFVNKNNNVLSRKSIESICKKAFELANLTEYNYTTHTLRHTAATYIYKATKDILVVKSILGHENLNSTEIYTHIIDDEIKDAFNKHPLANF